MSCARSRGFQFLCLSVSAVALAAMSVGATTAESVEAGAESPVLAPELVEAMRQRVSSRFGRALVRGGIVAGGVVVEANGAVRTLGAAEGVPAARGVDHLDPRDGRL